MRALCITLALVTLATSQAMARGTRFHFFATSTHRAKVWLVPAPRVQVFELKRYTVKIGKRTFHAFRIVPKLHCETGALCVPVYTKG